MNTNQSQWNHLTHIQEGIIISLKMEDTASSMNKEVMCKMLLVYNGFLALIKLLCKEFIAWRLKTEQKSFTLQHIRELFTIMSQGPRNCFKDIATWSVLQHVLKIKLSLWQLTQVKTQCSLFGTQFGQILSELTSLLMSGELKLLILVLMQITSLLYQVVLIRLLRLKRSHFGIWTAKVMNQSSQQRLHTMNSNDNTQWSSTHLTLKK